VLETTGGRARFGRCQRLGLLVSQVTEQGRDPVISDLVALLAEAGGEGVAGEAVARLVEFVASGAGCGEQDGGTGGQLG
jgi:hypothetical protein